MNCALKSLHFKEAWTVFFKSYTASILFNSWRMIEKLLQSLQSKRVLINDKPHLWRYISSSEKSHNSKLFVDNVLLWSGIALCLPCRMTGETIRWRLHIDRLLGGWDFYTSHCSYCSYWHFHQLTSKKLTGRKWYEKSLICLLFALRFSGFTGNLLFVVQLHSWLLSHDVGLQDQRIEWNTV